MTSSSSSITMPKHVAIIMDGSGRWAQAQGLRRNKGHDAGAKAVQNAISFALDNGIKSLSLYAFSIENWKRPTEEVNHLMELFAKALFDNRKYFALYKVQLNVIGNLDGLNPQLRADLQDAIRKTAKYSTLKLNIALNYSGQWDITHACRETAAEVQAQVMTQLLEQTPPEQLAQMSVQEVVAQSQELFRARWDMIAIEELLVKHLTVTDQDPIDLIIRTSNEIRLSNFFLWQAAYSEFVFLKEYWPEFDKELFMQAIVEFNQRKRRFGGV